MKSKRTKTPIALTPEKPAQFVYTNPTAKSVCVAGTFTNWTPTPMTPITGGIWSKALPLKPGTYEYRFVVDGAWTDDPSASQFAPNPFGTKNSVLRIN